MRWELLTMPASATHDILATLHPCVVGALTERRVPLPCAPPVRSYSRRRRRRSRYAASSLGL